MNSEDFVELKYSKKQLILDFLILILVMPSAGIAAPLFSAWQNHKPFRVEPVFILGLLCLALVIAIARHLQFKACYLRADASGIHYKDPRKKIDLAWHEISTCSEEKLPDPKGRMKDAVVLKNGIGETVFYYFEFFGEASDRESVKRFIRHKLTKQLTD